VGINWRVRLKRHHLDGRVSNYPTPTALEFFEQPSGQYVLPGMEEVRLIAGYEWDPDGRSMRDAVMSLRDGQENVIWIEHLPNPDTGSATIVRQVVPSAPKPTIHLPVDLAVDDSGEARSE